MVEKITSPSRYHAYVSEGYHCNVCPLASQHPSASQEITQAHILIISHKITNTTTPKRPQRSKDLYVLSSTQCTYTAAVPIPHILNPSSRSSYPSLSPVPPPVLHRNGRPDRQGVTGITRPVRQMVSWPCHRQRRVAGV